MLYSTPLITAYCVCVAAVLGLVMGSFLNCLAWRMTHGESVLHGRSHCTTCGHVLGPLDLVPVFSWLATGGRCRYCGDRVSWRYPATELLCGVIYVSILLRYNLTLEALELVCFASVLLVLSLTDLDDYIIPNVTIIAALVIRAVYLVVQGLLGQVSLLPALLGALGNGLAVAGPVLALAIIMDHVLGRDSFGGGDIKLLFVAGAYFGWQQCLFLVVVACIVGILAGMAGLRAASADSASADEAPAHLIPFGPAIALSCWITMLVGEQAIGWYLSLFM